MYFFIALIPAFLMAMFLAMALRYRAEFYPSLIFCSMIGIGYWQRFFNKKKILITAIGITLLALALVINGLFAERFRYFAHNVPNPQILCDLGLAKCKYTAP